MHYRMMQDQYQQGFTLIELMILIAIIGLLAAIAIPNFIAYRNKSFCPPAEEDAQAVKAALASYFSDTTRTALPTIAQLKSLEQLSTNNTNITMTETTGAGGSITISVTDGSDRCPKGTVFTTTMGGDQGRWT